MKRLKPSLTGLLFGIELLVPLPALAQQTVGLFLNDTPQEGLTLFGPVGSETTYLINNDGLLVNSWSTPFRPALMGYLLDNGNLLRSARLPSVHPNFSITGGRGGRLEEYDWDGNLVWEYEYSNADHLTHHDVEPLPSDNVLLIAWDYMSEAVAIAAGKNPALVTGGLLIDSVIEVSPVYPVGGIVVWEWHARDHLIQDFDATKGNFGVVEDHPELVDFNSGGARKDWTHFNGIDYNEQFDQILLTVHGLDEVWVIDHSTTTAEAAGHTGGIYGTGGDLLYRWGNPEVYRRGTVADQKLFGQHDAQWIATGRPGAGDILIFNNGRNRPAGDFSTVEEIAPPVDQYGNYSIPPGGAFGPDGPTWSYVADPPTSLFSTNISGAERQPNGNTLICDGDSGRFLEVEADGDVVWDYVSPDSLGEIVSQGSVPSNNSVFKVRRYPPSFPGFAGKDLTPGDPVEIFTSPLPIVAGSLVVTSVSPDGTSIEVEWDALSCPSFNYSLIYGDLQDLATYAASGAQCSIGTTGQYLWTGAPGSNLFFLILGTDPTGIYESSWGQDSGSAERFSTKASFLCGATTKVVSSTCP